MFGAPAFGVAAQFARRNGMPGAGSAPVGYGFPTVTWTPAGTLVLQRIYLSTTDNGFSGRGVLVNNATQQYRDLPAGATSAVITGLPSAVNWYYVTTEISVDGESNYSNVYDPVLAS